METKPFHEAIIDMINQVANRGELVVLGKLLRVTEVFQNHDQILEAFKRQGTRNDWSDGLLEKKLLKEKETLRRDNIQIVIEFIRK